MAATLLLAEEQVAEKKEEDAYIIWEPGKVAAVLLAEEEAAEEQEEDAYIIQEPKAVEALPLPETCMETQRPNLSNSCFSDVLVLLFY